MSFVPGTYFMQRYYGPMGLLASAALLCMMLVSDQSAHATFPLRTDGRPSISPTFGGRPGLYLITLEMAPIKDRHFTSCLFGGDLPSAPAPTGTVSRAGCPVSPAISIDWNLYDGAKLVAASGPSSMEGVEAFVTNSASKGRVQRELGSFQLESGRSYHLSVRETEFPARLVSAGPVVGVELHPWEAKKGLGPTVIEFWGAVVFGVAGLVWLGSLPRRA